MVKSVSQMTPWDENGLVWRRTFKGGRLDQLSVNHDVPAKANCVWTWEKHLKHPVSNYTTLICQTGVGEQA